MAGLRLYIYGALALGLIGAGIWIRGVFAERAEYKAQVTTVSKALVQAQAELAGCRSTNDLKDKAIDQANKGFAEMKARADALTKQLNGTVQTLLSQQGAYEKKLAEATRPLAPGDCEAQVREAARRMQP